MRCVSLRSDLPKREEILLDTFCEERKEPYGTHVWNMPESLRVIPLMKAEGLLNVNEIDDSGHPSYEVTLTAKGRDEARIIYLLDQMGLK